MSRARVYSIWMSCSSLLALWNSDICAHERQPVRPKFKFIGLKSNFLWNLWSSYKQIQFLENDININELL